MKTKIIFFGSDGYSLIVLKTLIRDKRFKIVGVVTPPHAKAIQNFAQEKKLPLITSTLMIRIIRVTKKLRSEVGILASFGKILPKEILVIPQHGILNVHPSLLPKYRGPSPAQTAILKGDKETGVTIIKMDEKMDHGPIISQFKEEIKLDDTAQSLYDRLFSAGAEVLKTILPAYLEGRIEMREQDHKKASYTKKLTRDSGFIPPEILQSAIRSRKLQSDKVTKFQSKVFSKNSATLPPCLAGRRVCHSATFLERFIRAMHPWPGAWTKIKLKMKNEKVKSKRFKILGAHLENGKLVLDEVQLDGKRPVTWKQFQEGYPQAKIIKS